MEMAASYCSPSLSSIYLFLFTLWFVFRSCLPLVKSVMHCWACTITDWFFPLISPSVFNLSAKLSVPAPWCRHLLNSQFMMLFSLPAGNALLAMEYYSIVSILCINISSSKRRWALEILNGLQFVVTGLLAAWKTGAYYFCFLYKRIETVENQMEKKINNAKMGHKWENNSTTCSANLL